MVLEQHYHFLILSCRDLNKLLEVFVEVSKSGPFENCEGQQGNLVFKCQQFHGASSKVS